MSSLPSVNFTTERVGQCQRRRISNEHLEEENISRQSSTSTVSTEPYLASDKSPTSEEIGQTEFSGSFSDEDFRNAEFFFYKILKPAARLETARQQVDFKAFWDLTYLTRNTSKPCRNLPVWYSRVLDVLHENFLKKYAITNERELIINEVFRVLKNKQTHRRLSNEETETLEPTAEEIELKEQKTNTLEMEQEDLRTVTRLNEEILKSLLQEKEQIKQDKEAFKKTKKSDYRTKKLLELERKLSAKAKRIDQQKKIKEKLESAWISLQVQLNHLRQKV